jgi:hypothetical protein
MKPFFALLLTASLAGCKHDADTVPLSDDLAGTWRLTDMQCFCPAGQQVKDEVITFDAAQRFQLSRDGQLAAEGTYALSQGSACTGGSGTQALLKLTASATTTYVPSGAYSIQNNTLVIDQCSAADGPKYTYRREK